MLVKSYFKKTYSTTIKCRSKESRRSVVRTEIGKCKIIQPKRICSRQYVGIGIDSGNQFAQHNSVRENITRFVVPQTVQALRTDEIWTADCIQAEFSTVFRNLNLTLLTLARRKNNNFYHFFGILDANPKSPTTASKNPSSDR